MKKCKCKKMLHYLLVLFLSVPIMINPITASAQESTQQDNSRTVKGTVIDEKGEAVIGALVKVVNSSVGAITDLDGGFSLQMPKGTTQIEVSFLAYETQVINVDKQTTLNIRLQPDAQLISEVVVVGYGSLRQRDITGSVAKISDKDFQQGFVTNAEQLIANKIPGVQVIPASGEPGAGSSFLVRGGASLNASNNPLIVIDGVPLEGQGTSPGFLSTLNPNDIETFSVLKDASAAAIYGSRGSNGVIIITTKKGASGAPRFSFGSKASISNLAKKVSVLNGDQYREIAVKASEYSGLPVSNFKLGDANTDWQDQIYQTALTFDNNFSVSGGLKNMPYRVSGAYLSQEGILKTGKYDRFTGSVNLAPSFFDDHLRFNFNLKASQENQRIADKRAIASAVSFDPTQPVYSGNTDFNGYFEYAHLASNPANLNGHLNPLGMLEQVDSRSKVFSSVGNVQIDYKFHFLPDLKANLNTGFDMSRTRESYFMNQFAFEQQIAKGLMYDNDPTKKKDNKFMEIYLNYVKEFKAIHSRIDAMAGYSYHDFKTKEYFYPTYNVFGDINESSIPAVRFDIPQNTLISYYGRLNYSFMDKYTLTATLRRDGSSRFAESNRWGTFPSLAFAWNAKDESFIKSIKALSSLKLRLGYGVTGQQDGIGNYDYISLYYQGGNDLQYPIGNDYYSQYKPSATDRNRKWEQTKTTNAGVDWGVLNDRISGSVDVYYKKTTDLLNTVNVPVGTDFTTTITKNIGSMENRGIEFVLNAQPIMSKNLNWTMSFNLTYNKNKITSLSLDNDSEVGLFSNSYLTNSVGYSRNTFYLYKQAYDANGKPIEDVMIDLNDDGIINEKDRYRSKSSTPKFILGYSTTLQYNKFSLSMAFHANIGNYMYYNNNNNMVAVYGWLVPYNLNKEVYDTGFRKSGNQLQQYSDYYLQNASFLKMDNISLSYDFGKVFKSFSSDATLSVTGSVQNVFTLTKYTGQDPEASWNWGIDWGTGYSVPRTFSLGLNLNF